MKDLIKMLDETVGGNAYGDATLTSQGQAKSRFTRTGRPPGIWEAEDLPIVAKRLKDIFDKVDGSEFWMNHFKFKYGIPFPTNLKDINKEQALAMNKFGSHMAQAMKEVTTKAYAGIDAIQSIKKDPKYNTLQGDAKKDLEDKLKGGGAVELEEKENMNNKNLRGLMAQGEKIAAFANKQSGYEGGVSSPVRDVLAAMTVAGAPDFDGDDEMVSYYTRRLTKAIETQKDKKYMSGFSVDESYATVVNKIKKSGKSEKAAKAIAGAVASYKAKGGGKGPTAKQK